MLSSALTLLQLPGRATRRALKTSFSPGAVNTLSTAIAQGSIQTASRTQQVSIEGLDVEIKFNDQRLLTTAGISSAIAFGTVYWLGTRLKVQFRYAAMIEALQTLDVAIKANKAEDVADTLSLIDRLSDPLIDPETLEPIDSPKEVRAIFEQVMKKPAEPGSMFNASKLTSAIDDAFKTGSRTAVLLASESVEEGIDAMIKKAVPLASRGAVRVVGAVLWIDTVYWLGTSALDVGLNYLGVPEQAQRIPFLADIPGIGALFDFSDGLGASAVDLVLTPILEGVFSLLGLNDVKESAIDALWALIISAASNPSITPFIIAVLDFYIEDVEITFTLDVLFPIDGVNLDFRLDLFGVFRPEPLDVLIVWLYAVVGKIVFKAWIVPAFDAIKTR